GAPRVGVYLAGYAPAFSEPFAEWLETRRSQVHGNARRAAVVALAELRSQSRFAEAEALARSCLELDPLNEEATLALAECAALSGSKTEALSILDQYLAEVGDGAGDLRLPASVLRRRISERLSMPQYTASREPMLVGRADAMMELAVQWAATQTRTSRC